MKDAVKYGVYRLTWRKHFDQNDLKTLFRQVKKTGAGTVEMRLPDETLQNDRKKTTGAEKLAEEIGVQLLFCYGYPKGMDMRSPDPFIRQHAVEHLKRTVKVAYCLGGTEIGDILYFTWPADYQNDMITPEVKCERAQYSLECIRKVIPATEDYYIQLNMEIVGQFKSYTISTIQGGLDFIRQIEGDHCSLLLDVFHMNLEEDDVLQVIRCVKGHVGQFHVSEPNRQIPYQNRRINWQGIGRIPWEIRYDDTVTVEAVVTFGNEASYNLRIWHNQITDAGMKARIAAMRAGLIFLRQQFKPSEFLEKARA